MAKFVPLFHRPTMLKLFLRRNGDQIVHQTLSFARISPPSILFFSATTSSSSSSIEIKHSFANYLVKSLGFSEQQSLSTSTKLARFSGGKKVSHFDFAVNANSVIHFFKQHGFNDTQIRIVVSFDPRILFSKIDKTLVPKFNLLKQHGFSREDIVEVISSNPHLLLIGLENGLFPAILALKERMGCDRDILLVLKKTHWSILSYISKHLSRNVGSLLSRGIPLDLIREHLLKLPHSLLVKPETFEDALIKVEEKLGITRQSPAVFLRGITLLINYREKNVNLRIERYKSFGWTESDVIALARKNPSCFTMSESAITKKLGFLMNELGFKPAYIALHCNLLTCSLEKRVVPRHKVLMVLKDKDLIEMNYPFANVIWFSESRFVDKFVLPFKEVHQLYAKLVGIGVEKLTAEPLRLNANPA